MLLPGLTIAPQKTAAGVGGVWANPRIKKVKDRARKNPDFLKWCKCVGLK